MIEYKSPFHITHDEETADRICAEVDATMENSTDKDFDRWWSEYWKPTGQPEAFNMAMMEIAQNAWSAAIKPTDWQPIETAPIDGTKILLLGNGGKVADGYCGRSEGWANPKCFVWPYIHANPTHWRPLPNSPDLIQG